tara:strand:+ start:34 stop:201 length:168 start_codon:yes stop_codon:yes gene_type:complete
MASDEEMGVVEKNSDYFARKDGNQSMNITDLDGRSDNYLAEIRRISAIKPSKEAE